MSDNMKRMLSYPWRTDVFLPILRAAIEGRLIYYSDLPGGRFHWGKYLARIAAEEERQGRPPLTAIVVAKGTGRPQYGFMDAMRDIGHAVPAGQSEEDFWRDAVASVHGFWRRA
jgi:hypothetical protein